MRDLDALIWGENASERHFLEHHLRAGGFTVESFSLLSEILPPCISRKYKVILVSLDQPSSRSPKGIKERVRVIRELDPEVPIVVISETVSLELERMLRNEGIFYFLPLPYSSSELVEVVRCAIQKKKAEEPEFH